MIAYTSGAGIENGASALTTTSEAMQFSLLAAIDGNTSITLEMGFQLEFQRDVAVVCNGKGFDEGRLRSCNEEDDSAFFSSRVWSRRIGCESIRWEVKGMEEEEEK